MSNLDLINQLFEQQQANNWKPAAVFFKLKDKHEKGEIELTSEDLIELGKRLNYSPTWASKKFEELKLFNPNAPKRSLFDGMMKIQEVKPYSTKKGDKMAFLELISPSGYEIQGVIFPHAFLQYGHLLIEEEIFWIVAKWDRRDDNHMLVIQGVFELSNPQDLFNYIQSLDIELNP